LGRARPRDGDLFVSGLPSVKSGSETPTNACQMFVPDPNKRED